VRSPAFAALCAAGEELGVVPAAEGRGEGGSFEAEAAARLPCEDSAGSPCRGPPPPPGLDDDDDDDAAAAVVAAVAAGGAKVSSCR